MKTSVKVKWTALMVAAPLATLIISSILKLATGKVEFFSVSDFIAASISISIAALISACKYSEDEINTINKQVSKETEKGDIVIKLSGSGIVALVFYLVALNFEINQIPEQTWLRVVVLLVSLLYSGFNAFYCCITTHLYEVKGVKMSENVDTGKQG